MASLGKPSVKAGEFMSREVLSDHAHSPAIDLTYDHTSPSFSILQDDPVVDPIDDVVFERLDDLVQQVPGEKLMDVGSG